MSKQKDSEAHWIKNSIDIYIAPKDETPHVEPVRFSVRVQGFTNMQKRPAEKGATQQGADCTEPNDKII